MSLFVCFVLTESGAGHEGFVLGAASGGVIKAMAPVSVTSFNELLVILVRPSGFC